MKWITARRRHPLAGYVVVIIALAFLGVGYAFIAPTSDYAVADTVAEEQGEVDIANGKQIYTQSCMSCHGEDGKGRTKEETGSAVALGAKPGRCRSRGRGLLRQHRPYAVF